MGVIVGDGENKGVTIWTNDKTAKNNNLVFAFHGTPLLKIFAERIQRIETGYKTKSKVFMPYTKGWTSTMSHARLVKEMDKYYQLTKKIYLKPKQLILRRIHMVPLKHWRFYTQLRKTKKTDQQFLQKLKTCICITE